MPADRPGPRDPRPLLFAANTDWYLANFRLRLMARLIAEGHSVVAVAPRGPYVHRIQQAGVRFLDVPMDNAGSNPLRDLVLLGRLLFVLRRERPLAFFGHTIKPNIYGGLACRWLGIPSVHNISGLGSLFLQPGWRARLVLALYRRALASSRRVFLQNGEDRQFFLRHRLAPADRLRLLPGSGVDVERFVPADACAAGDPSSVRFLLSGRLLWHKGVGEFVTAARLLKQQGYRVECQLLGFCDARNPSAIGRGVVEDWVARGWIRYLGATDDVRSVIAQADCVVLPSYREGVPRALLEAASMGKPLITCDSVGCRDTVDDGVNGFLCRPRDSEDLAQAMVRMLRLSPQRRQQMGRAGRQKMLREFDENRVIEQYREVVGQILSRHAAAR